MSKQVQDAYICAATRLPIGKSGRGYFKNTRPDEMLSRVIQAAMAQVPGLDPSVIEDAIIGCSFPEGEQGMNIARVAAVLSGLPNTVGGVTVNRYCASGITALAMAADRIRVGESEVMIAGGVESMSMVPMGGNKPSFPPAIFERDENIGLAYGMGLTAEKVADKWKVSRQAQDEFALESHRRALAAIEGGFFKDEITPFELKDRQPDLNGDGVLDDVNAQITVPPKEGNFASAIKINTTLGNGDGTNLVGSDALPFKGNSIRTPYIDANGRERLRTEQQLAAEFYSDDDTAVRYFTPEQVAMMAMTTV